LLQHLRGKAPERHQREAPRDDQAKEIRKDGRMKSEDIYACLIALVLVLAWAVVLFALSE
jgi:hypothetical protein